MGSWGKRMHGKAADGGQVRWRLGDWTVPRSSADKPGGTTGEVDRWHNPGFQWGEIKPQKPLTEKTCGSCGGGRNSQPHRKVCWRDPQGPRMYTSSPTWESAPEGPNLLVGSGGSDWKYWPLPHIQHHTTVTWVAHPGEYLRLLPLQHNRCAKTKKYGPNETTDQNCRKRTKW